MAEYNIIILDEIESTNAYALEFMHSLEDKTIIAAKHQTKGYGRYKRSWISDDSSNLYASIVLKPENAQDYPFANLTQQLSVIACRVLENKYNIQTSIKWPNDILASGAKLAGILAETSLENNIIKGIALGIGINVNMKKETLEKIDQKAVSMAVLKNKEFDAEEVLKNICGCFFENYDAFIKHGFPLIKDEYVKRCTFLGNEITIREKNMRCTAQSIDSSGLLTVKDSLGKEMKIMTGDILCAV